MRSLALPLILLPIILLTACGRDYFPLGGGKSWRYELIFTSPGGSAPIVGKSLRMNLPKRITLGEGDNARKTVGQLHENGLIYLYKHLGGEQPGVYRLAVRQDKLYYPPRPLLVMPDDPQVGHGWVRPDRTYLLVQRYPLDVGDRAVVRFDMAYRVVATDKKVRTPAGVFADCLYVVGGGTTDFIATRGVGNIRVEVQEENWFAPSVGLVKSIRREKTDTELFGTRSFTMQLEEYRG